ncbi:MAG TPA: aminoglycoside phosphotransferase family protein [Gemmatimonadales bacterium]|nr:aminoglycoside phosphotransferase family protein [Gemmatimonadales bacterium]
MNVAAARSIAERFALEGEIVSVAPLAGGHINDSYRVDVQAGGASRAYLLQALNRRVFPRPDLVMENVARVTRHLASRLEAAGVTDPERQALSLVPTRRGAEWHTEADGTCWRVFRFITGTVVLDRARDPQDAGSAGRAFGRFLLLLADYDGPPLHETIPGFHDTAARIALLDVVAQADPCRRAGAARREIAAVMAHRPLADVLPPLIASGEVPRRIVHNDAKISNVLLDERTGEALCVIDLDTVMPGSALWDFGDMIRSMTSPSAEDEEDLTRVGVRMPMFAALARGYLEAAGTLLVPRERELLGFAGRLITLEQAVRFLTDYLEGDRYYRIERAGHNLTRCRTQLALLQSLTDHAAELDAIVAEQGA